MSTLKASAAVVGKASAGLLVLLLAACGGGGSSGGGDNGDGDSGGAVSTAAFCDELATVLGHIDAASSNGAPPGQDDLVQLSTELHGVAGKAPDDTVESDLNTVADYFQAGSVHGIDSVDADVTTEANAAGERIGAWGDANCGEAPDGG